MEYIDVTRETLTNLPDKAEARITDIWVTEEKPFLSSPWTGKTIFDLIPLQPKEGYEIHDGRVARKKTSSKPDNIRTEVWASMSDKRRKQATEDWKILEPKLKIARATRGINQCIPAEQEERYEKIMADVQTRLTLPTAAAMPVIISAKDPKIEETLSDKNHIDLLEIFGGKAGTSKQAKIRSLKVGINFDIEEGMNLTKEEDVERLLEYIDIHTPTVVVMGPPCTAFGSWAHYDKVHAPEAYEESLIISKALAAVAARIADKQLQAGRHFLLENPRGSQNFNEEGLSTLDDKFGIYAADFPQCAAGLVSPTGEPIQKWTTFWASHPVLLKRFRNLECTHGPGEHWILEGKHEGVSRTKIAQVWSTKMCRWIARSVEELCHAQNKACHAMADGDIRVTKPCRHKKRQHDDSFSTAGYISSEWYALVHTPIPIKKAMKIPKAKEAVDGEWTKLFKKGAWKYNTVKNRKDIEAEALAKGEKVHFANLMDLCHEKRSALPMHMGKFKGRVVLRGDNIKDEASFYAVFSEQGTSASHMDGCKFLDALARMPDNDGEDCDAIGAYHQVRLQDMRDHPQMGASFVETWVKLPRGRYPKWWDGKYQNPYVKLELNLYGHPLAGLYWEKHCQTVLFGFWDFHGLLDGNWRVHQSIPF